MDKIKFSRDDTKRKLMKETHKDIFILDFLERNRRGIQIDEAEETGDDAVK
jgi:hypothetical protein